MSWIGVIFLLTILSAPLILIWVVRFCTIQVYARTAREEPPQTVRVGFILSFVLTALFTVRGCGLISADAQGGIALIFWQFNALWVAVIAYGVGWSAWTLFLAVSRRARSKGPSSASAAIGLPSVAVALVTLLTVTVGLFLLITHDMVRKTATSRQSSDVELRGVLKGTWAKYDTDLLTALAKNSVSPGDILDQLSQHPTPAVRAAVAHNPNTPAKILRDLSGDPDPSVRQRSAANPNTPHDILYELARTDSEEIARRLGGNRGAPVAILRQLAMHSSVFVRREVAANVTTPPDVLRTLSEDVNRSVRDRVAGNRATPLDILNGLSTDSEPFVRRSLASNPSLPEDKLRELAEDIDEHVRVSARISMTQRRIK